MYNGKKDCQIFKMAHCLDENKMHVLYLIDDRVS